MKMNAGITVIIRSIAIALILVGVIFAATMKFTMEGTENMDIGKQVEYQGHQVYYEVRGNSEKTIVFIHGWTGSIESWKYQLNAFDDYKVIAIDLPGHGRSSKELEADYGIALLVDAVRAVLMEEKIEKAFVFGHSMGFALAEVFALKYPDMCIGIGSIDGAHFELPDDENGRQGWIEYNRSFAKSMDEEKGREDFINALMLPDTPRLLREEALAVSRQVPLPIGQAIIASMEDNMEFWEKRVMDIPCLAIHSPVYQLTQEYKDDFMAMYPQAEYHEIDNVSHYLMLEMPYKVNQIIHDYLAENY